MSHSPTSSTVQSENILRYWFPKTVDGVVDEMRSIKLWYAGSIEVDQYIRENFAADWQLAQSGKLSHW